MFTPKVSNSYLQPRFPSLGGEVFMDGWLRLGPMAAMFVINGAQRAKLTVQTKGTEISGNNSTLIGFHRAVPQSLTHSSHDAGGDPPLPPPPPPPTVHNILIFVIIELNTDRIRHVLLTLLNVGTNCFHTRR